jgi:hypothetical protein
MVIHVRLSCQTMSSERLSEERSDPAGRVVKLTPLPLEIEKGYGMGVVDSRMIPQLAEVVNRRCSLVGGSCSVTKAKERWMDDVFSAKQSPMMAARRRLEPLSVGSRKRAAGNVRFSPDSIPRKCGVPDSLTSKSRRLALR